MATIKNGLAWLPLDRCPHCNINKPQLSKFGNLGITDNFHGSNKRLWCIYKCHSCGGCVMVCSPENSSHNVKLYPGSIRAKKEIPERARYYLDQAIETKHSPSASIVMSAASIDAMLKLKGYENGSLYSRIDQAASDHLITDEMKEWAHDIRLDANDERHADINSVLPAEKDSMRCIDFAQALGEILFVLPERVKRGRNQTSQE